MESKQEKVEIAELRNLLDPFLKTSILDTPIFSILQLLVKQTQLESNPIEVSYYIVRSTP